MLTGNHPISALFKKIIPGTTGYGREIAAALAVKFALLTVLWWLFFAGHKQTVDDDRMAARLFDAHLSITQTAKSRENIQ